jgi:uncharacterized protein
MKRVLTVFLLCIAVAASVRARQTGAQQSSGQETSAQQSTTRRADADAPATKEDVEAYLAVTHSRELAANITAAMSKPLHQMMHEEYLKNKEKLPPDFEARMNKQTDDMMKNMPFDEMIEAMVPSYQKHFSRGDIDALVAFYSSPTGQKILKEMPAIAAEAMQNMMPIVQKYVSTVQQQLQQQVAQLLQQSSAPAKNPPPSSN